MFSLPQGPELIVIIAIALIIFGPKKLPEIGKAIGQTLRELRKASREVMDSLDLRSDINLNLDEDDSSYSRENCYPTQVDTHVETPKENEQDAANSNDADGTGIVDNRSGNSVALRCEETTGDR